MRNLLVLFFLSAMTSLSAQTGLGFTASYSFSTTPSSDTYSDLTRKSFGDAIKFNGQERGVSYGLTYRADFDRLFLRADAVVAKSSTSYTFAEIIRGESGVMENFSTFEDQRHYLSIPITAGVSIRKFDIGVGPTLDFEIEQSIAGDLPSSVSTVSRTVETGANVYLGYNVNKHITINARYQTSMQNLGNSFRYASSPMAFDQKTSRVDIGLAFYL